MDITEVPTNVVKAAMADLVNGLLNNKTVDLPTGLVKELVDYLSLDLGCCHEENICTCSTQSVVTALKNCLV